LVERVQQVEALVTRDLSWKKEVERLESDGENQKVINLLLEIAERGDVIARVALAEKYWKAQRYVEARQELERAEQLVQSDDDDAHWELYWAYTLGVSGLIGLEKYKKAFDHLCKSAELSGNPWLYMKVGSHYWGGLNGVDVDLDKADQWLSDAASAGFPEAVEKYKKFKKWRKEKAAKTKET
jgi:TPR repeat protein